MKKIVTASVGVVMVVMVLIALMPAYHAPSDNTTLDVFIIDGQSNAAYQNVAGSVDMDVVNNSLGVPDHKLYYYGSEYRPTMYSDTVTTYAIHPLYTTEYVMGGLVAPFAYYLSESQNRDILVLDVGISAQSISNLVPDSVGGEWKIKIVKDALNSISGYADINLIGWCWLQGESDINMPVATYKAYFNDLENWYKSIGCENCYIVKTREQYGGNATIAQAQLIQSNPNIHLGTDITDTFTGTSYMLDNLHYDQAARILIAESVTENIPIKVYGNWETVDMLISIIPLILISGVLIAIVGYTVYTRIE